MPLYVYRREDGTEIEVRQSIHDATLTACPETGQPVQRVLQAFGSPNLGRRFYEANPGAAASKRSA